MNLKAIIRKIASWFKDEEKTVETRYVAGIDAVKRKVDAIDNVIKADALTIESFAGRYTITAELAQSLTGSNMSTPTVATQATTGNNVNTAVQIALALKAIDATLSVEQVQAATNAALAAAYPVAA